MLTGITSSVLTPKLSILQRFSKLFSKKGKKSSSKDKKVTDLEVKLAAYRVQLLKANQENEKLIKENSEFEKTVEELEKKLFDAQVLTTTNCDVHFTIVERLSQEKKVLIKEHALDKNALISRVQSLYQIITDMKNVEAKQIQIQDLLEAEKELEDEKKVVNKIRRKNLQWMKKQLAQEENKNGLSFGWKSCEICLEPYGNKENNTPRILRCGHTFCQACTEKLSEGDYVKCPFDRMFTNIKRSDIKKSLPKNFTVLNMCEP